MATKRVRFASARKAAGYTQERFAELLNVDRSTVRRWEAEGSLPQPWLWPKIARLLDVSADKLQELLAETQTPRRQDDTADQPAAVDWSSAQQTTPSPGDGARDCERAGVQHRTFRIGVLGFGPCVSRR